MRKPNLLFFSPFDKKKKSLRKKVEVMKLFPNEVMALADRQLDSLNISPFTKYLIGCDNELDEGIRQKVLGKVKVVMY